MLSPPFYLSALGLDLQKSGTIPTGSMRAGKWRIPGNIRIEKSDGGAPALPGGDDFLHASDNSFKFLFCAFH
jgi:hypothetical protein